MKELMHKISQYKFEKRFQYYPFFLVWRMENSWTWLLASAWHLVRLFCCIKTGWRASQNKTEQIMCI
jgi:hypothetical protein